MAGVPLLIFANKQDLIAALPPEEIEETLNLDMINDRSWTIVACSAKEKQGKWELMNWNRVARRPGVAYAECIGMIFKVRRFMTIR